MTQEQMMQRLKSAYPDGRIEVYDLTGGENHWQVGIESASFRGLSRIQQHQNVMAVFSAELKTGEVHALTITVKAL